MSALSNLLICRLIVDAPRHKLSCPRKSLRTRRCALGSYTPDDTSNRLAKVTLSQSPEAAKGTYLHNALGQRVFKSEPMVDHVAPNASTLGAGFVAWLQSNFGWLFAQAQSNATLGQSYVYDDALGDVPVLLGEYGNGGSNSSGRREYLWLPVNGQAMPIGVYTNTTLHAVHADHLNTPRLVAAGPTSTSWQWPYSAFGDERPVDQLVELSASSLRTPYLVDYASGARLYAFEPSSTSLSIPDSIMNLRFPGQYFDSETGLSYNYFRSYLPSQGRYAQPDPIGLDGGLNRFGYVDANPLSIIDPEGLAGIGGDGAVTVNAYPGPQAGGIEHGRFGAGGSYHVHIRDSQGNIVRMSTETWKPLTPQDQKIFDNSKQIKSYCDSLTEGQKKFLDRVNREVFHKGYPTVRQLERIGAMRGGARVSGKGVE